MRSDRLTDFHVGLEGKHRGQDQPPRVGDQRQADVPQEAQRVVAAVQQVQTADDVILETGLVPLVDAQQSKLDGKLKRKDGDRLLLRLR